MINEEMVMKIIVNGGQAKSFSMKAIAEARLGNFAEAEQLLQMANEALLLAHEVQTNLIQDEASGKHHTVTLLMVHAQDHLMNAMTVKDLVTEMIEIIKDNKTIKNN